MNYRQLETFRAVMLSGSASRASELLGVSQPAVSRAIAELEKSLGFHLFDRVRGRLVPTHEGRLFVAELEKSFAGLDRLKSEAARIRDFGAGAIRIACLAALGSTLVPRAIKRFHEKHPGIPVTLQIHPSSIVRELVATGSFDLGLAADEVDVTSLEHRSFWSTRAVCAIPKDHALATRRTVHPRDLDGQDFIALATEDRARQRMTKVFADHDVKPRIIVETPASATACALALCGVGIALVNPAATDGFRERGLVLRPFEPAVYFESILLFRPDTQRSRLVKALTAALLAARTG